MARCVDGVWSGRATCDGNFASGVDACPGSVVVLVDLGPSELSNLCLLALNHDGSRGEALREALRLYGEKRLKTLRERGGISKGEQA